MAAKMFLENGSKHMRNDEALMETIVDMLIKNCIFEKVKMKNFNLNDKRRIYKTLAVDVKCNFLCSVVFFTQLKIYSYENLEI